MVVEWLAGLLMDSLGPVDLVYVRLGADDSAVGPLHGVEETVAGRVRDQLAWLTSDIAVDHDVGADLVVIPHVAGRKLEVPIHFASVGVPGDGAVGEEVVAGPVGWVEHRHRIAGTPDGLVGVWIIGAGHPDGAAAGLPGVVPVLPGLTAGLARRRDRVLLPQPPAGRGLKPRHPRPPALIA